MFHYIRKDFQNMIKTEKFLVVLLIIIQIMSSILVFFSYGVANNYSAKIGVAESFDLRFAFEAVEGETFTKEETDRFFMKFYPLIENKFERVWLGGYVDNMWICSTAGYENGKYTSCKMLTDTIYPMREADDRYVYYDSKYIDEKFENGERVALVGVKYYEEGASTIKLGNNTYQVVGVSEGPTYNCIYIPYATIPNEIEANLFAVFFEKPLLRTEYEFMISYALECFGNRIEIPEFVGIENENEYQVFNNIIFILVAFVFMCAINYCIIYNYILHKRRRMFAVSRMCGCSKVKAVSIYMIEILSLSLIALIIGLIVFIKVVQPISNNYFDYMKYYFNTKVYVEITLIYIAMIFFTYLVLVTGFVKKTPVLLMKGVE